MTEEPAVQQVDVCVCTFKRPRLLARLLEGLFDQRTEGLFTYSVIVVDNDAGQSAKQVVETLGGLSRVELRYCTEPVQNISLARNRAVRSATGDFLAFIDDDEQPPRDWLLTLFRALGAWGADGVLGPVIPRYEAPPPRWLVRGGFYERPSHRTGTRLDWRDTRTGNALIRRNVFQASDEWFLEKFGGVGGEDRDFFRRMIRKGHEFVWCDEAPVYEAVPPERFKRTFLLKRALMRGKIPHCSPSDYAKSFLAVPLYALCLPVTCLMGHHVFMWTLIREFTHIGRLLSLVGADAVRQKYVME